MQRRMKIGATSILLGSLFLAGCSSAGGSKNANGSELELKLAYEAPTDTAQSIAAEIFEEELESNTDGDITVKAYPDGQLASEGDTIDKLAAGDIDVGITSVANASTVMPESGVLSLHYLAQSGEQAAQLFQSQQVNEEYSSLVKENVDGVEALTLFMLPMRNMYYESEISSKADMAGIKTRVQATDTEDKFFNAYGAKTSHIDMPELYSSLQTGVVDAAEGDVVTYEAQKHYELAPVMSLTQHEANGQVLWISSKVMDSLDDDQRQALEKAAEKVRDEQPELALQLESEVFDDLEEKGVKIHRDVDVESFSELAEPIQDEAAEAISEDAVEFLEIIRQEVK